MGIACTLCASKGKIGSGYEFKFNEVRNAIFHDRPLVLRDVAYNENAANTVFGRILIEKTAHAHVSER
ncbi:MAG: hypothetical protein JRL30_08065 [Deltaproteobacteria bacterium]|nr:hypothetical protein [Deltaproteobacteria bacterium]